MTILDIMPQTDDADGKRCNIKLHTYKKNEAAVYVVFYFLSKVSCCCLVKASLSPIFPLVSQP